MDCVKEFIKLVTENPDLPIIPMVDCDVVGGDEYGWWLASFGMSRLDEFYLGRERVHFRSDADEEEALSDLAGCNWCQDEQGRDIYELTDEEWDKLYASIPWEKCIVVYIGSA